MILKSIINIKMFVVIHHNLKVVICSYFNFTIRIIINEKDGENENIENMST